MIIGVDYHPSFQQIAFCTEETGECGEQRLSHHSGEAEHFYRDLRQKGISVRAGMEANGYSRWFERLLLELPGRLESGCSVECGNQSSSERPTAQLRRANDPAPAVGRPYHPGPLRRFFGYSQCGREDCRPAVLGLPLSLAPLLQNRPPFRKPSPD